ncbi:hypothetical protein V8G54_024207 [Vigna mungo]|uniref:Uncharacterized protein n=1 Tax=Vigna mungo TaxID=3915 RepID=A0AAQ3N6C3_VIGMU
MNQSNFNVSSQTFVSVTDHLRRSANYKPNIWKHHFLQSLYSKYHKEEFVMVLNKLVMEVKSLFAQETSILKQLELVDWIQKLGLANYFQKEINGFLESINLSEEQDLHVSALCFRLLRNHGYAVLPDMLSKFLDKNGKVKRTISSHAGDVKHVVELLEASHLGLEGEKILDKAKICAINSLKDTFSVSSIKDQLSDTVDAERVVHSLELSSHWRVQWFEVKWHVKQYSKEKNMNHVLLELSKLNFNMIQATLQLELKELSRWWENLGIKEELSFARNRLVESFMCAAGVAFEPKHKSIRKWLTKVIVFVLVIDDVYDIHASFQELKPFTMAFERWDDTEVEELPTYMKTCVNALKDVTNEIAYEIGGENNFHLVLHYLKKAAERERGDAASSIVCYMKEEGVSEEKARKHIEDKIIEAWKKINKCYGCCSSCWVEPFLTQAINAARVGHTLYQNGDGFGIQDRDIKKHILSLVVEPL